MKQSKKSTKEAKKTLDAAQTGLDQAIEYYRDKGASLPAVAVEVGKGRQVWNEETTAGQIAAIGQMYQKDLMKSPQPITPKQAIAAGIPEEIINTLSGTPTRGVKIKPATTDQARRVFGAK